MFSSSVTETDSFLELPLKSQALYFHLGMQGDDDGFVANPRAIIRSIGCTARDLKPLETAGYVISFPSKVLVITDWKANNNLRNDRYKPTAFQNELAQLTESANKRYILASLGIPTGNQMDTIGIPSDNQVTTQHSIAEHSSGRSCKKAATTAARTDSDLAQIVQHFQAEIGEFPRSALDKLQRYREAFSTELICKAIDEAAENGVRKWRYVDGILKGWQADGVRTLGDVEARREARRKPRARDEKEMEVLTGTHRTCCLVRCWHSQTLHRIPCRIWMWSTLHQMCNLSLLPYQDFGIQLARWMLCRSANGIQT